MCITNAFTEKTLKGIREYEAGNQNEKEMAEVLASIKVLQEDLEKAEKLIKNDMKENYSGEIYYFSGLGKKVYLSEGKKSSEYNVKRIQESVPPELFIQIVNVVKKKVDSLDDKLLSEVVESNKESKQGDPYLTVLKMNKTELIEHKA